MECLGDYMWHERKEQENKSQMFQKQIFLLFLPVKHQQLFKVPNDLFEELSGFANQIKFGFHSASLLI